MIIQKIWVEGLGELVTLQQTNRFLQMVQHDVATIQISLVQW